MIQPRTKHKAPRTPLLQPRTKHKAPRTPLLQPRTKHQELRCSNRELSTKNQEHAKRHVIDWMMDLPTNMALQFENELLLFEREKQMPYVTSIEQHGIEKGIERGELVGQIRLYQRLSGQQEQPREQLLSQTVEALQSQLTQLQQSFESGNKD